MKIKSDFALRKAMYSWVVFPLGAQNTHLKSVMTLNKTGAMLWKHLEGGCTQAALVEALLAEYDISEEQAQADVEEFIAALQQNGCLEEEKEDTV